jgi:hypothetical protein
LAGLLVGAPVIVGLKMQGDVEHEMVGDLLGKDTRQRVRTHDASASMLMGHR